MVALLIVLFLIIQGLGGVVNAFSRINPAEVIGAIVNPITSIPVTHVWCKAIGIGCGPDRYAGFKTEIFGSLKPPPSTEQSSSGADFFDCLNNLRITRQLEAGNSHLVTLSWKVMQFEHHLEAPEDLRGNLTKLAEMIKDVVYNANTARVRGRSSSLALVDISPSLSLAELVGQQAHKELSRLHNIQNKEESGLGFLAYGWTEPFWPIFQSGWVGRKKNRQDAALFLKEVIQEIDEGVMAMIRWNALSLQQCAERAFSLQDPFGGVEYRCSVEGVCVPYYRRSTGRPFLQEPPEELSIDAQLKQLVLRIEGLRAGLGELKREVEAVRRAIAGATTPPA